MDMQKNHIAVFDSGVGGISVLKCLLNIMPNENYVYFGDSKNAPYGLKTTEAVRSLTVKNVDKLIDGGAKAVVIACNTATSASIDYIRDIHRGTIIIGIEPALKPAVLHKPHSTVAVMATPVTLREEKFQRLMKSYEDMANIIKIPAPHLVELIEQGKTDDAETEEYIKEAFSPYSDMTFDSIVLGCTHFPFAANVLKRLFPQCTLFDGGDGTAKETMRRLKEANLLNSSSNGSLTLDFESEEEKNIAKNLLLL